VITVVQQCGDRFGVEPICRVLGYRSASTVYARRNRHPSARQVRDEQVLAAIGTVRVGHAACYGARRTWLALRRAGVEVARCTVERLMRQAGLLGVQRGRKAPRTTTPDRFAVRPPDLVNRDFTATRPDQLWLSDITYVPTLEGFVYVAFVMDAFSRRIIGWQTADHLRTDLPLDALEMALWNRNVHDGQTVHHSDAGSQYRSIRYTTRLSDVGIMPSVGTVADSYDNAMAEALNGTFKAELIDRCGPWKTRAQTEIAIYEWISWYNHARIHTSIGDVPPVEYEHNHYSQITTPAPTGAR
jgi:transposase InsO family protein